MKLIKLIKLINPTEQVFVQSLESVGWLFKQKDNIAGALESEIKQGTYGNLKVYSLYSEMPNDGRGESRTIIIIHGDIQGKY